MINFILAVFVGFMIPIMIVGAFTGDGDLAVLTGIVGAIYAGWENLRRR